MLNTVNAPSSSALPSSGNALNSGQNSTSNFFVLEKVSSSEQNPASQFSTTPSGDCISHLFKKKVVAVEIVEIKMHI